jgi:hypothetical protein
VVGHWKHYPDWVYIGNDTWAWRDADGNDHGTINRPADWEGDDPSDFGMGDGKGPDGGQQ